MFCRHCGAPVNPNFVFCERCGKPTSSKVQPVNNPPVVAPRSTSSPVIPRVSTSNPVVPRVSTSNPVVPRVSTSNPVAPRVSTSNPMPRASVTEPNLITTMAVDIKKFISRHIAGFAIFESILAMVMILLIVIFIVFGDKLGY